jgi:hypothetical protein
VGGGGIRPREWIGLLPDHDVTSGSMWGLGLPPTVHNILYLFDF